MQGERNSPTLKVVVIGTGYVGLVTAVCLAQLGHHVVGLDIDQNKIELLQEGRCPIYEPGLEELLQKNIQAKRLSFTTSYSCAFSEASYCFLCLPTPSQNDGSADLHYLENAVVQLVPHLQRDINLINKSTAPPGTIHHLALLLKQRQKLQQNGKQFQISWISNPEFLREGNALHDCFHPDRIILGVDDPKAIEAMESLYAPLVGGLNKILVMDILSAELTKYAANGMLATRISFMNELSRLCDILGADIEAVRKGIGSDSRIGPAFLYAGVGYGGSCFPKDIRALIAKGVEMGLPMPILSSVDRVNQEQRYYFYRKIVNYYGALGGFEGKKITIWGVAFKAQTDDIREAPALDIIKWLLEAGAEVNICDPEAQANTKVYFKDHPLNHQIHWSPTASESVEGSHGIILMTDWVEFRSVNLTEISLKMHRQVFFDGRNVFKKEAVRALGFDYFGIGVRGDSQEVLQLK